jgi:hypothetical protein
LVQVNGPGDPDEGSLATLAVLTEEMRWRLYALVRAAHRPVNREEAAASIGISRKLAASHLEARYRRPAACALRFPGSRPPDGAHTQDL